nr:MAG TPA: hypothetical protein [Caudoviricetes sp.]
MSAVFRRTASQSPPPTDCSPRRPDKPARNGPNPDRKPTPCAK